MRTRQFRARLFTEAIQEFERTAGAEMLASRFAAEVESSRAEVEHSPPPAASHR